MLFKNINTVAYEIIITSNGHGEIFQVFSILVVVLWKKSPLLPSLFMIDTSADKLSICLLKRLVEKQNLGKHEAALVCFLFFFSWVTEEPYDISEKYYIEFIKIMCLESLWQSKCQAVFNYELLESGGYS